MAILTKKFIQSLGIELDDETFAAFDDHFEETLSKRVIESILEDLNDQQLQELASLESQSEDVIHQWLIDNVPELGEIINDEVAILIGELAENSEQI